ncbi:MAG: hypothetical protein ACE5NG_04795 [bacterium]
MYKLLNNLVVVIGVFVISSGIFFLMYENQAVKEEVFGRSLQLLGEQLLSMVPEGEGKAAVAEKWQKFTSIAEKGEVPPERIERVAIGILIWTQFFPLRRLKTFSPWPLLTRLSCLTGP